MQASSRGYQVLSAGIPLLLTFGATEGFVIGFVTVAHAIIANAVALAHGRGPIDDARAWVHTIRRGPGGCTHGTVVRIPMPPIPIVEALTLPIERIA